MSLRGLIERVGPSPATVLVTGETGTGKELVAEALHLQSPRNKAPMVRINCGALPSNLVEAELFGHERGAFTGADRPKPGRFELAHGGTLFLDEIGELPPAAQVTLLRVVEDGVVERVGSTRSRRVDVRLIAATNRDLEREVQEGNFRQDLLYRLRVMEIHVPPLREHADDIPLLVEFFLDKHSQRLGRPRPQITPEALEALTKCSWPGNVRELENAVERAVLLTTESTMGTAEFGLSPEIPQRDDAVEAVGDAGTQGIKGVAHAAATEAERRLIRAALDFTRGNITRAAERLGLSRRGLQLKMKALGLQRETPGK
jgi:transcriptional regulator with GAF, ATPase, and Fis domain